MNVRPMLKPLEGCTEVSCSSRSHKEVRAEGTPGSVADRLLLVMRSLGKGAQH